MVFAALVLPIAEVLHREFKDAFLKETPFMTYLSDRRPIYSYSDESKVQRSRFR